MSHLQKLLDKSEEVRNRTLSSHDLEEFEVHASGFNSWLLDNPTPGPSPIWHTAIFECNVLSEASFFMAVHGFYERASAALRGVLEGFLVRLYWDIKRSKSEIREWEEQGVQRNEYAQWELGLSRSFPGLHKSVIPLLKSHELIGNFDLRFGLLNRSIELLGSLNLYVHGRPSTRHYGGASRSSSINIEYKEKHLLEWYQALKSAHSMIGQYSILTYPYMLSFNVGSSLKNFHPNDHSRIVDYLADATD